MVQENPPLPSAVHVFVPPCGAGKAHSIQGTTIIDGNEKNASHGKDQKQQQQLNKNLQTLVTLSLSMLRLMLSHEVWGARYHRSMDIVYLQFEKEMIKFRDIYLSYPK